MQQQFGYYDPHLILKLLSIYSTALYGSPLWQLGSEEHLKLNRSWNTAVKMIWDLPHATHTCYLESLSLVPHLQSVLNGRYVGFVQSLGNPKNKLLPLLFNLTCSDLSTVTGQNVNFLMTKFEKPTLSSLINDRVHIKKSRVYNLRDHETWKIKLIEEISLIKKDHLEVSFEDDDLEEILMHVCTD